MSKSLAILSKEAVAASTAYILVDLSLTSTYPHGDADYLTLHSLMLNAEKASDGVYDVRVGVITELDATNGTAAWVHEFHLEAVGNPTDSTDRFAQQVDFDGLALDVDPAGTRLVNVIGPTQAGHTNWQTDVTLDNPDGNAVAPAVGDLVVWVEEVSGTGTLDFSLSALYEAGF